MSKGLHFLFVLHLRSEISITQAGSTKYLAIAMSMYNLLKYNKSYFEISGSLWQYFRDEPSDPITDYDLFEFKTKITWNSYYNLTTWSFVMIVLLKYLIITDMATQVAHADNPRSVFRTQSNIYNGSFCKNS